MNEILNKIFKNRFLCITIFFILIIIIGIIYFGNSFAFRSSTIDLNENGEIEVGDVVKLRNYIVNGYKTFPVTINMNNINFRDDTYCYSEENAIKYVGTEVNGEIVTIEVPYIQKGYCYEYPIHNQYNSLDYLSEKIYHSVLPESYVVGTQENSKFDVYKYVAGTNARFYIKLVGNYVFDSVTCDKDVTYDYNNNILTIHNVNDETNCSFNVKLKETLNKLIYDGIKESTIIGNGTLDLSNTTTGSTYYATKDNYGMSYYYNGINNGYVYFAGFYWQIVRVNGDGSIRLIYHGPIVSKNTSESHSIGKVAYNSESNPGYMYTSGLLHGYNTSSNIKTFIDKWYEDHLASYSNYLADEIFCNDQSTYSGTIEGITYNGDGITTAGAFSAANRLVASTSPMSPKSSSASLICNNKDDAYTVSDTINGNGKLKYPIGLLTADEMVLAGGVINKTNNNHYLYTGMGNYWSMTPYTFDGTSHKMFILNNYGATNADIYSKEYEVRPVINLKKDTIVEAKYTPLIYEVVDK